MFLQQGLYKQWSFFCLCLSILLLTGPIRSGEAKVMNNRASDQAEIQTDNLAGIKKGDPIGILYYRYRVNQGEWVVGIHNGVALANLKDNMPDVPLGHYSSKAFNEKALCFHKPTPNDVLGGYRRIDVEPYSDAYTHAAAIGYQVGNKVNNAAFAQLDPDPTPKDPNPKPITDVNKAVAFFTKPANAGRTGTLYYGHWNIKPSATIKGAFTPFWDETFKRDVSNIQILATNIDNNCTLA